jgi:hypothetical protein
MPQGRHLGSSPAGMARYPCPPSGRRRPAASRPRSAPTQPRCYRASERWACNGQRRRNAPDGPPRRMLTGIQPRPGPLQRPVPVSGGGLDEDARARWPRAELGPRRPAWPRAGPATVGGRRKRNNCAPPPGSLERTRCNVYSSSEKYMAPLPFAVNGALPSPPTAHPSPATSSAPSPRGRIYSDRVHRGHPHGGIS